MELTNEFTVPVPVERAWEVLNDVELIAPCLPGAQLQEIEGDEYRGIVKVKVGPITAQYKGAARFLEQDVENRRIVLEAGGRDTRGQGSADAVITATMVETDGSTHVSVVSDVTIKGKVAQFGRGMIAEVSAKLLTQFVECLEGKLDAPPATADGAAPAPETAGANASSSDAPAAETPSPAAADVPTDATADATAADRETVTGAEPAAQTAVGGTAPSTPEPAPSQPVVRKIDAPAAAPVDLLDTAGSSVAKRAAPVAAVLIGLVLVGWKRARSRR